MGSSHFTIYLIRHASPDWTRNDVPYYKPPGPPLTEHGRIEAELLGAYLKDSDISRLYTSPLERCQHTAEIAADLTGAPMQVEHGLIEWQPGETPEAVRQRMWMVFEQVQRAADDDHIAGLVTHGGPIAMLLSALGMDEATLQSWRKFDHGNPVPPAGVWQATRGDIDGGWDLALVFNPSENN